MPDTGPLDESCPGGLKGCACCARADAYRKALQAAMGAHTKQCMGYDDCRVCQTGGWDVLDS